VQVCEEEERKKKEVRENRLNPICTYQSTGTLEDQTPFIITEYIAMGSLMSVIQKQKTPFSLYQKIGFCIDAANGMKYLHSSSPPHVHRDLKPQKYFRFTNIMNMPFFVAITYSLSLSLSFVVFW